MRRIAVIAGTTGKFLKVLAIGAVIVTGLVILTEYLTEGSSSVRLINASDHDIDVTFISEEPHRSYSISMDIRSDSDVYMTLKNEPHIVWYRVNGEKNFKKDNIEITGKTIFKFTEENGELVLKEKE
jgi:hypothetical protein